MTLTKSRKRRKLLVAGLLALTPAVVVISWLQLRWKPPGGIAFQRLTLEGHRFPVQALTFGPDGKTLASAACYLGATQTGVEVEMWDVGTGNLVDKRLEHPGALRCLTFAPGGRRLAATVRDRDVVLWDVGTWRERGRLEVRADFGNTIALSDDAAQLATANCQDGVTVWDAGNGRARSSWKVHVVSSLATAP
jgi:WD40 repeat protein